MPESYSTISLMDEELDADMLLLDVRRENILIDGRRIRCRDVIDVVAEWMHTIFVAAIQSTHQLCIVFWPMLKCCARSIAQTCQIGD